jgi:hypothetical protein
MSKNKIQALLISHLSKHGHIDLRLPDGMVLEIGIDQEGKDGELEKKDDYCWVIASQKNRATSIDSYNLGLRFEDDDSKLVFEDRFVDTTGEKVRRLDVV